MSTRGGFARAYVPAKHPVHAYRQAVAASARAAGVDVTSAPVEVFVLAFFARPKSHMNKSGIKQSAPRLPRCDADNIAKAVLDALTGIAWHDDNQVCDLHVTKRYGDAAKTEVSIVDISANV